MFRADTTIPYCIRSRTHGRIHARSVARGRGTLSSLNGYSSVTTKGGSHVCRHADADFPVVDADCKRRRLVNEATMPALLVPVIIGIPVLLVGGYYLAQVIK